MRVSAEVKHASQREMKRFQSEHHNSHVVAGKYLKLAFGRDTLFLLVYASGVSY